MDSLTKTLKANATAAENHGQVCPVSRLRSELAHQAVEFPSLSANPFAANGQYTGDAGAHALRTFGNSTESAPPQTASEDSSDISIRQERTTPSRRTRGILVSSLRRLNRTEVQQAATAPPKLSPPMIEPVTRPIQEVAAAPIAEAHRWETEILDPLPHFFGDEQVERSPGNLFFPENYRETVPEPATTNGHRADSDLNGRMLEMISNGTLIGQDRRAHPRRESGCTVTVCRRPPHASLTAQQISWLLHAGHLKGRLIDVSMSGMALQIPEPLESGTMIFLRVANRNFDHNVDAVGQVLRCTPHEGQWHVVCRLDQTLTFEQVHRIGKHLFTSTIV